jgi:hypothetical protein
MVAKNIPPENLTLHVIDGDPCSCVYCEESAHDIHRALEDRICTLCVHLLRLCLATSIC